MATFNVSDASGLISAIRNANGGDTILLAGGDYGSLSLSGRQDPDLKFATNLTIASANPDNPAVFTALRLHEVRNITLDGLKYELRTTATTPTEVQPFKVESSSGVVIRNGTFEGEDAKGGGALLTGYGIGYGLRVIRSSDVVLEDSEFTNFQLAATFSGSQDLTIRNNTIGGMSGDGLKFGEVRDVLIEGNTITGHRTNPGNGYHRDMIQFLTMNQTTPTENVTIRGNILHSGDGPWSQSIFISNEAVALQGKGQAMYYRNILIEDNLIYNAQVHGIRLGETVGLTIRNNTLLHNMAGEFRPEHAPEIVVNTASQDVSITRNIAEAITANSRWTVTGNLLVQRTDPAGANYYDDLFVSADRPDAPVEALQALPGGLIQSLGVGAAMTRFDPTPDKLTALALEVRDEGTHFFDASLSAGPGGLVGNGGVYQWNFGDGSTATGRIVSHDYAAPGDYTVTLRVAQGGASDEFRFVVEAADTTLLALRFGSGRPDDTSSYDANATVRGAGMTVSGGAITLADGGSILLDRAMTRHLHALDDFTLSFNLQRANTTSASTGKLMEIDASWTASMDSTGRIVFDVTNSDGDTARITSTRAITDTALHNVSIHYDGEDGLARIFIDGGLAGSGAVDGATPAMRAWAPIVGNPFGESFNGRISAIDIVEGEAIGGVGSRASGATAIAGATAIRTDAQAPDAADPRVAEVAGALGSTAVNDLAASLGIDSHRDGRGNANDNLVTTTGTLLSGRGGDDILIGNNRANTLDGGAGDDVLAGRGGADTFRFNGGARTGSDTDVVMDLSFAAGDRLVLGGYAAGSFADADAASGLVLAGGGGVALRSLAGIEALAAADAVTVGIDGTDLMLGIDQGAELHALRLVGLGEAYEALLA